MFKPTIVLALAVLALVILVAGCGGSSYGGDEPAAEKTVPAAATSRPAAPAAAGGTVVELRDSVFQPADIEAKVGQKITFENKGQIPHTATATAGAKFDSGTLAPGQSFEYVARKAGTIEYVCVFHPGMAGTIEVS